MSDPKKPPEEEKAKEDLLAQFAADKTHVQPGRDGTINYNSTVAMSSMVFGGPLRIPRKEDNQYDGTLPVPTYEAATGQKPLKPEKEKKEHGVRAWLDRRREKKGGME